MARVYEVKWKTGKAHRVVYKDKAGVEQAKQFKKKAKALEFVEKLSTLNDTSKITVKTAGELWLGVVKTVGRNGRAPVGKSTWSAYERAMKLWINPSLGADRLSRLSAPDIVRFRTDLLEKTSRANARKSLGFLSMICNEMITQGLLSANPCTTVKIVGNKGRHTKQIVVPEPSTIEAILDDGAGGALIDLLIFSGMRISEALGLEISVDDLSMGLVTVVQRLSDEQEIGPVKSLSSQRTIRIPKATVKALRTEAGTRKSGFLFESATGGPRSYHNFMVRVWRPMLKRLGLLNFGLHGLRHYHASLMISNGATPLEVCKKLGHSDPGFTLRVYGHLFAENENHRTAQAEALRPKKKRAKKPRAVEKQSKSAGSPA